ncbi:MAG: hypothetical protein NTX53_18855 [candidate division WOR-3 bacterium]|nr:hypothetical protein [candidate division WOR-3 bacterium]
MNSSALRRGNTEPYSALHILNLAKDAGVRAFTVGSDAHRPADLDRDLGTAVRVLEDIGVRPARFRRRKLVPAT